MSYEAIKAFIILLYLPIQKQRAVSKTKRPTLNSETALKILIYLLAIFFLWSLYHRFIYADDGWLGEQAHAMANCGRVKTRLFELYYQQFGMGGTPIYVYHKLFIWLGGLLIYLIGHFNPYLLKSISLAAYIALIGIVLYDYRNRLPHKHTSILILLFYFLALPNLIYISFTYRPEIAVALFGYLSFRHLKVQRGKKSFLLAGLFAGIAVLFHLNALVFILAGVIYIALYHKNFRSVLLFGLGASICLFYFVDVVYDHAYLSWWERLNIHPATVNSGYIRNSLPFHITWRKLNTLFFRSSRELAYSIPLILTLYFLVRHNITAVKAEVRYLAILIFALFFLSKSGLFYNIYLYPYALVLIAYAISIALSRKDYTHYIAILVLGCSFSMAIYQCTYFIFKKNTDIYRVYKMVNQTIPKGSRVLAPTSIAFNPRLTDYDVASTFNAALMIRPADRKWINAFCIQNHFDYVVADKNFLEKFKLNPHIFKPLLSIPKTYWVYKVTPPE